MSGIHAGAVIVGIDGSASSERALTWAADEAAWRGVPLVVTHAGDVANVKALSPATAERVAHEVADFATTLLADAVDAVADNHPDLEVTTVLRDGSPTAVLTELSFAAALLVVGRGEHAFLERLLIGSNARRLANEAHCPVVVVSEQLPEAVAQVVVGVSPTQNGLQAMRAACAEAALRGAEVRAIRSWSDFTWAGVSGEFSVTAPIKSVVSAQQSVLDLVVDSFRQAFPEITINAELSMQPPDIALTSVERAGLLVVGRRREAGSVLPRLGPVTSWLIEHTPYPVMVVGDDVAVVAADDMILEHVGAARPTATVTS